MGQPVDERVPEGAGQAGEHEQGEDRHDGHGVAPAPDPDALQEHDQRVEQQGDEPRHHHEQEDLAQLVDELAGQERGTTTPTVIRMACRGTRRSSDHSHSRARRVTGGEGISDIASSMAARVPPDRGTATAAEPVDWPVSGL